MRPKYAGARSAPTALGGGSLAVAIASGQGHEGAVPHHQRGAVLSGARVHAGGSVVVPDAKHVHFFVAVGSGSVGRCGPIGNGRRGAIDASRRWVDVHRRRRGSRGADMGHGLEGNERAAFTARRDMCARAIPGRHASTATRLQRARNNHAAHICSDVERTIRFYQDVLGFPLLEMFEDPQLGQRALLLRPRAGQHARLLRPTRCRGRPVRRGARWPSPSGDLHGTRRMGSHTGRGWTRQVSSTPTWTVRRCTSTALTESAWS